MNIEPIVRKIEIKILHHKMRNLLRRFDFFKHRGSSNHPINGIFLNMKDLNKKTIKEITQYLKYIEIQQKQLDTDENIKKTYANDYFNDNKEKGV